MAGETKLFDYKTDIDVGPHGITGDYDQMMTALRFHASRALITLFVWAWVTTWPSDAVLYRIGSFITVTLLIKVLLLVWTYRKWRPLTLVAPRAAHWLSLEFEGLHWIRKNNRLYRVTFFRPSDGSITVDYSSRFDRFQSELAAKRKRAASWKRASLELLRPSIILCLIPIGFYFLHIYADAPVAAYFVHIREDGADAIIADWLHQNIPYIPFEKILVSVEGFFALWSVEFFVMWWWFLTKVFPILVRIALTFGEIAVTNKGAQFVTGARVFDPVDPEITAESTWDERKSRNTDFVEPAEAARKMSE